MSAVVYVRQDANVLSKGSTFMGEEVEDTTFYRNMQKWQPKNDVFSMFSAKMVVIWQIYVILYPQKAVILHRNSK